MGPGSGGPSPVVERERRVRSGGLGKELSKVGRAWCNVSGEGGPGYVRVSPCELYAVRNLCAAQIGGPICVCVVPPLSSGGGWSP